MSDHGGRRHCARPADFLPGRFVFKLQGAINKLLFYGQTSPEYLFVAICARAPPHSARVAFAAAAPPPFPAPRRLPRSCCPEAGRRSRSPASPTTLPAKTAAPWVVGGLQAVSLFAATEK